MASISGLHEQIMRNLAFIYGDTRASLFRIIVTAHPTRLPPSNPLTIPSPPPLISISPSPPLSPPSPPPPPQQQPLRYRARILQYAHSTTVPNDATPAPINIFAQHVCGRQSAGSVQGALESLMEGLAREAGAIVEEWLGEDDVDEDYGGQGEDEDDEDGEDEGEGEVGGSSGEEGGDEGSGAAGKL